MNRREAISALMGLPASARITRAAVTSTDVIVVESDALLAEHQHAYIRQVMNDVWPSNKVVVLDGSLRLRIAETKA